MNPKKNRQDAHNKAQEERSEKAKQIYHALERAAATVHYLLENNDTMTYPEACTHPDTEKHIKEATSIARTL